MSAFMRGYILRHKLRDCGRRLLVSKGLDFQIDNADVHFGNNVRIYSNVKLSVIG